MDGVVLLLGLLLLASASQKRSSLTDQPKPDVHSWLGSESFPGGHSRERSEFERDYPNVDSRETYETSESTETYESVQTINEVSASPETNTRNLSNTLVVQDIAVQYILQAEALPWVDAVHACARAGARLAVPRSRRQAELLGQLLRNRAAQVSGAVTRDGMYVGISDIATSDWATLDGQTPTAAGYDAWLGNRSGKPNHNNCVALLPNGFYIRSDCGSRLAFACEKSSEVEGYVEVPGLGKYRVHTDPLPWVDAVQKCKSEGAVLAVPTSGVETGFLAGYFIFGSQNENIRKNGLFIGISDIADEGTWQTVTGVDVATTNCTWGMQGSGRGRTANCGVLHWNGKFADHPCEEPLAFCCKESRFLQYSESVSEYTTIEGAGKYRLHKDKATWLAAALKCLEDNATLATPHTLEVRQLLWEWIRDEDISQDSKFHLGVHDIDGDGTFTTLLNYSDEEQLHHAMWPEYPKGQASSCIAMEGETKLYYESCATPYPYLCEKPLD